jgi:hypothetical protein
MLPSRWTTLFFSRILNFKNKMIPDPQFLRLKDRFSKYQFTIKHIKGKNNVLADFLSRPKFSPPLLVSFVNKFIPWFMISSSPPAEIQQFSSLAEVYLFAHTHLFTYQYVFVSEYHAINPNNFRDFLLYDLKNPNLKPYESVLTLSTDYLLCEHGYWCLWCLSLTCYCALEFETSKFRDYFNNSQNHCSSLL